MARIRSDRLVFKKNGSIAPTVGHPKWYGDEVKLNDKSRSIDPDKVRVFDSQTKKGKNIKVTVEIWGHMVFRGTKDYEAHKYPFTLYKIELTDDLGKAIYSHPLCLSVYGDRRDELEDEIVKLIYLRRFDLEIFFRFAKRNLLLDNFQTPDVRHEESWVTISSLANNLLYAARHLSEKFIYPWEKSKYKETSKKLSPSMVQRGYSQILKLTPRLVDPPKKRGQSPGRKPGHSPNKRPDRDVVFKKTIEEKLAKDKKRLEVAPLHATFGNLDNSSIKIPEFDHLRNKSDSRERAYLSKLEINSLFDEQGNIIQRNCNDPPTKA
jgi:hypothetical protein